MGELSKPFMTPLGVMYRSLCDTDAQALKYASWAVKLFGGEASLQNIIGPGRKGCYEASVLATIPEGTKLLKPRSTNDLSWISTPEQAYVFFDALETPASLYFHKHEMIFRPTLTPPMMAYFIVDLEQ
jgi:hypothetical protein